MNHPRTFFAFIPMLTCSAAAFTFGFELASSSMSGWRRKLLSSLKISTLLRFVPWVGGACTACQSTTNKGQKPASSRRLPLKLEPGSVPHLHCNRACMPGARRLQRRDGHPQRCTLGTQAIEGRQHGADGRRSESSGCRHVKQNAASCPE